nr:methyltransferase domain-containing protein [Kineococcus aurantiacus]
MKQELRRAKSALGRRSVARSALARRVTLLLRSVDLRRADPLSEWGFERGTPVDRFYIERFLQEQREHVHGRVLEVKEDQYATASGASAVDVLDIDPANPLATVVGDLCDEVTLAAGTYDAAVVTQTLQYVPDPRAALRNLLVALRPQGRLLVTVPCLSRLAGEGDRWRWTARGFSDLVAAAGGAGDVRAVGNGAAARAFLLGAAAEELPRATLLTDDPEVPLLVTAVLHRA